MIRLSIIVPVYNTEKFLGRCLDSLIQQDIPAEEYEIIVIDDGSPDNSASIVADYMNRYSQIRLVSQSNQGLFKTRNKGIKLAKGQYIYFIDSDDFIAINVLGKIIQGMDKLRLDFLGFGMVKTPENFIPPVDLNPAKWKKSAVMKGTDYMSHNQFHNESVWFVLRKELLQEKDFQYQTGIAISDGIFTAEAIFHSNRMLVIPEEIYAYFQRPSSIMNVKDPGQYRYVLERFEATAINYRNFREKLERSRLLKAPGIRRLYVKEQAYIFFMLIRVVKSDLNWQEVKGLLIRLKESGFYPLTDFIGKDYNGAAYRILVMVLNYPILLYPAILSYRMISKFQKMFKKPNR